MDMLYLQSYLKTIKPLFGNLWSCLISVTPETSDSHKIKVWAAVYWVVMFCQTPHGLRKITISPEELTWHTVWVKEHLMSIWLEITPQWERLQPIIQDESTKKTIMNSCSWEIRFLLMNELSLPYENADVLTIQIHLIMLVVAAGKYNHISCVLHSAAATWLANHSPPWAKMAKMLFLKVKWNLVTFECFDLWFAPHFNCKCLHMQLESDCYIQQAVRCMFHLLNSDLASSMSTEGSGCFSSFS